MLLTFTGHGFLIFKFNYFLLSINVLSIMKFSHLHRVYANVKLTKSCSLNLAENHCHYFKTVLRLKVNDYFRIFNDIDGEFIAQIISMIKNNLCIRLINIIRKVTVIPQLVLGISIIKNDKMLDAIDMAVQLGVTKIVPLITERSQLRSVNIRKFMECIIKSTEQSERLIPAILMPLIPLSLFLDQNLNNYIVYANENENENNTLLKVMPTYLSDISVVVGPEGGFSYDELKMFSLRPNTLSISLGPNVLRTETAVATCLAQIKLFMGCPSYN